MTPPKFKSSDEVFSHVVQDGQDIYPAATVLTTKDNSDVRIRLVVPDADRKTEDVVHPGELTQAKDPVKENKTAPEKTLLEHALDCVRRGWFVFPCYPGVKAPAGDVVPHGVNQATNDESVIRGWWEKNPNYNPAIALGPSNLVVYDFDTIKPFDNLPPTFTVQTGREQVNGIVGIQKYFIGSCKTHGHPGGGGEVRSRGAYVMAPGAVHPSGMPYVIISDLPLAPSPEQNQEAEKPFGPAIAMGEQETIADYVENAFDAAGIDYHARVAHGESGLKWFIRCPWHSEHTSGKDFDTSSAVIMWPSGKLIYECKHSHCLGIRQWKELRACMQQKVGHYLVFGEPVEVLLNSKPSDSKLPVRSTTELSQAHREQDTKPAAVSIDPSDWRKYFKRVGELEDGDVRMIVKGLLPEGTSFVGALSGHCKTLFALSLTKALTTGRPMFDCFEIPEKMPVLYLIPESSGRAFKSRLKKFGIPDDDTKFLCRTLSDGPTLFLDDPYLRAAVENMKPLVILDTAIRFSQANDENAAIQNQKLVNDMIALRVAGAQSVVAIHHSTKASADAKMTLENVLRGTGDLGACADCVYGIKRDENLYDNGDGPLEIEVVCVKPRDFDPPPPFRIIAKYKGKDGNFVSTIDTVGDFVVRDKEAETFNMTSRIIKTIEGQSSISIRDLADDLKLNKTKVERLLKTLGYSKARGQKNWSCPQSPQAETGTSIKKHCLPSDEFLASFLAGGPVLVSEVDAEFTKYKYTRSAIASAKSALDVETFRKHDDPRQWMRLPEETNATSQNDEEQMDFRGDI